MGNSWNDGWRAKESAAGAANSAVGQATEISSPIPCPAGSFCGAANSAVGQATASTIKQVISNHNGGQ